MYKPNRTTSHAFILGALLVAACQDEPAGDGRTQTTDNGASSTDPEDDPRPSGQGGGARPADRDGSARPSDRDGSIASSDGGRTRSDDDAGTTPDDNDGDTAGQNGASDPPSDHTREACELVPATTGDGPSGALELEVEVVVSGLEIPWGLAWLPDGDMLVTERPGRLRRLRGGQLQATPVLEVDVAEVSFLEELSLGSEGGLLGVLLHPEFETNRLFYLYYTARDANDALINRLGVYELAADGNSAEFQRLLLDDIPSGLHHQGGRMHIGPDEKLYVGVGAYDPSLAQQPGELPGKLLRMNLDGSVPDDNPTPGSLVFLTGVRNTQGYDWFDDQHLLVMDHGPTSIDPGVPEKGWDEFNVARAGENLGWPDIRGCETASGISEPVIVWERSMPPAGAAIYRGTAIPEWTGSFFVATLGLPGSGEGEHLHRIQVSPDNPYVVEKHEVYLKGAYGRLRTVAMGPDGHLYVTTSNCDSRGEPNGRCTNGGDQVLRIVGAN